MKLVWNASYVGSQIPQQIYQQFVGQKVDLIVVRNFSNKTLSFAKDRASATFDIIAPYDAKTLLIPDGWSTLYVSADNASVLTTDFIVIQAYDSEGGALFAPFPVSGLGLSGNSFYRPLSLGPNGGIYQGTGTFNAPVTGLKIWNQGGIGTLATYLNGTVQVSLDTNGRLVAGGGAITLDSSGLHAGGVSINTNGQLVAGGGAITLDSSGLHAGGVSINTNGQLVAANGSIVMGSNGLAIGNLSTSQYLTLFSSTIYGSDKLYFSYSDGTWTISSAFGSPPQGGGSIGMRQGYISLAPGGGYPYSLVISSSGTQITGPLSAQGINCSSIYSSGNIQSNTYVIGGYGTFPSGIFLTSDNSTCYLYYSGGTNGAIWARINGVFYKVAGP